MEGRHRGEEKGQALLGKDGGGIVIGYGDGDANRNVTIRFASKQVRDTIYY